MRGRSLSASRNQAPYHQAISSGCPAEADVTTRDLNSEAEIPRVVPSPPPPRLSAIIPNYNHGAVIGEAIRALAAQVPAPDEIVVVDDASRDDSLSVLAELAAEIPILRVIALPANGGAIAALNRGLLESRGTYVYFGAADDVTCPGLFAAMFGILAAHPQAAFACCEGAVQDLDTGATSLRPPVRPAYSACFLSPAAVAERFRRIDNWILTGTAVVRRDLMTQNGGFDATFGAFADAYAMRRLALLHGCCFAPHLGMVWRINSQGLSRQQAGDPVVSLATLETALAHMRADPAFPAWYPAVFARRWRFGVGRIAVASEPMNAAILMQVSARGVIGRTVLRIATTIGGRAGRLLALGWLTLRERPTSLTGLMKTFVSRRRAHRMIG